MKASDYIVDFLVNKGITDTFGYPGGSVTHLVDSFHKRKEIQSHVTYHEQGAAFAACAYAQVSGKPGVAYATGGPGATNLITGIGHAYYDSVPLICLTGNVNVYEARGEYGIRQRGFQESDIISVIRPLVKYCAYVEDVNKLPMYLNEAYHYAMEGRRGPVLIDLPMNILREEVSELIYDENDSQILKSNVKTDFAKEVAESLLSAERPCLILGNAVKNYFVTEDEISYLRKMIDEMGIPYVTSMLAFDVAGKNEYNYGFLGAYGHRTANIIAEKSDLIISIGSRMDVRQVGAKRANFAKNAKIIRVDIDEEELKYKVHEDEKSYALHVVDAIDAIKELSIQKDFSAWKNVCNEIRHKLSNEKVLLPNLLMSEFSRIIPDNTIITTDVGQNQVWVAQSSELKPKQKYLFCGGFGAMGYALPAAIGAYYGAGCNKSIICICGDGGLQMNIQELQFVVRENLPIKILVFNNYSLGMIRHFQEMYFDKKYYDTSAEGGYTTPCFVDIGRAYGIQAYQVNGVSDIDEVEDVLLNDEPAMIEICIHDDTYVFPKLEFGKPNYDQQPLLDRELITELMSL